MKNEYKITKDLIKSWAKEYQIHGAADIFFFREPLKIDSRI